MANKNFPCKGCTNRTVGCHINCGSYNEAKLNYENVKKKERLYNDIDNFLKQSTIDRIDYYKSKRQYRDH